MESRPTMTPDEEAAWGAAMRRRPARPVLMDRPRAPKVMVAPIQRMTPHRERHGQPVPIATARKPRHWTVPMMGWCRLCCARTPQTAKHFAAQHREDIDITCDRCGGMVARRSVALAPRVTQTPRSKKAR